METLYRLKQRLDSLTQEDLFSGPGLSNRYLASGRLDIRMIPELLRDESRERLEILANRAAHEKLRYFGRTVQFFTPIYISNYCVNSCSYCSFACRNEFNRSRLSMEELERECAAVSERGIQQVLILTGEDNRRAGFDYISRSISQVAEYFPSIGVEVYPLSEPEYRELVGAGLESLTMYQETYNRDLYKRYHPAGPKSDYDYRLETADRACRAGIRGVTIGALLGLDDPVVELMRLAVHIAYLERNYPEVELSVSFPRLCPLEGEFEPAYIVSDEMLVRMVAVFRTVFPSVGITLSTREREGIRNGLLRIGITKVSAGVSTSVGGHISGDPGTSQFEISDTRSVEGMKQEVVSAGMQPVMANWDRRLVQ